MNRLKQLFVGFLAGMAAVGLVLVCGGTAVAMDSFPCAAGDKLDQSVAPEAELEDFSCFFKKWEGAENLHFKVTLKNISDKPQRYRVNIFLDNGKAVGGLIPRKTKKGLVQPGTSAAFTYPVKGMSTKPESVMLRVTTAGQ